MNQAEPIILLSVLLVAGFLAQKLKLLPEHAVHSFNKYVVNIGLPFVVFLAIVTANRDSAARLLGFVLLNIVALAGAYLVSFGVARVLKWGYKLTGAFVVTTVAANVAFVGLPIIQANYSREYFDYAAVYIIAFSVTISFVLFPLMQLAQGKKKFSLASLLKRAFVSPLSIGAIAGLILLALNIQLPVIVIKAVQPLAQISTTLAMLSLGIFYCQRVAASKARAGVVCNSCEAGNDAAYGIDYS